MEAHRYPDDFDGIVAGAPAVDTTGRAAFSMWIAQQQHRGEGTHIPAEKYPAIHNAALDACDALDGVTDRIIENPRACKFDPKVIECKAGDAATLPDAGAGRNGAHDVQAADAIRAPAP